MLTILAAAHPVLSALLAAEVVGAAAHIALQARAAKAPRNWALMAVLSLFWLPLAGVVLALYAFDCGDEGGRRQRARSPVTRVRSPRPMSLPAFARR